MFRFLLACCFLFPFVVSAQVTRVELKDFVKDERFEKFNLNLSLFLLQNDTAYTMDFEGLREAKPVVVKKPEGYSYYAYGYLFFAGNQNPHNPGYVNILVADVYKQKPYLYLDLNNNYDFTDDGAPKILPSFSESLLVKLCRNEQPECCVQVLLTRNSYYNKQSYKQLLDEYYEFYYKDKKFVGVDHCFREQRYVTRSGKMSFDGDSFLVALHDGNTNGRYNEADSDRVVTANIGDTIVESNDEFYSFAVSKKKEEMFIDKNGMQFEIAEIDPCGQYIDLKPAAETQRQRKLSIGEKAPNIKYVSWESKQYKLKKLRKYQVYIYFTGKNAKNFSKDTALLRVIAAKYPDRVKVIGFIDVNKSYELKIFGQRNNLNWIAAFKNKEVNRSLGVRGLPSSLWLGKRRRVQQYNITPEQFLQKMDELYGSPPVK